VRSVIVNITRLNAVELLSCYILRTFRAEAI